MDFEKFPSIGRVLRKIVITEKIDGTNGQIAFDDMMEKMYVGSRNRWLDEDNDNYGFYKWAKSNEDELRKLGPGRHYGEWWGQGVQRTYDMKEKRFSLFNTSRWNNPSRPSCCDVVPIIYSGDFNVDAINNTMNYLKENGSVVAPGFMNPEGVVVFHTHLNTMMKVTFDDRHKGEIV